VDLITTSRRSAQRISAGRIANQRTALSAAIEKEFIFTTDGSRDNGDESITNAKLFWNVMEQLPFIASALLRISNSFGFPKPLRF
jgi:hypothetical protein